MTLLKSRIGNWGRANKTCSYWWLSKLEYNVIFCIIHIKFQKCSAVSKSYHDTLGVTHNLQIGAMNSSMYVISIVL